MSDVKEARVPDIGDFDGVPVIEVLIKSGDTVKKDQSLVTLESDKATMEVPAAFAGTVKEVKVSEGDEVAEGAVIALIEVDDEDGGSDRDKSEKSSSDAAEDDEAASDDTADKQEKDDADEDQADQEKDGDQDQGEDSTDASGRSDDADEDRGGREETSTSKRESDAGSKRTPPVPFDASIVMPDKAPYASPSVRAFARELGVDVGQVEGSGRKGRILREDVSKYVKHALGSGAKPMGGGGGGGRDLLPWPKVDFSKFGEVEEKPLSRIKKISGANLARNWALIPHVTQHDEADITEMEAFRKKLGQENKDLKVTPLVFQIKAVVAALKEFPQFNVSLDAAGETLTFKKYFNIGIAVDTPDGLVVPVIRDADTKGLLELAKELGELSGKARDKKLSSAEMSGGCFSISSLGGIGGTSFTPIVNAPEAAILGVSRAQMKPVWNGEEFRPRLMLPLSLSYDHRVIDGADAARFAAYLARMLGDIRRLLL